MKAQEKPEIPSSSTLDYAITTTKGNFASLTANSDQKANIIIAITSLIYTISLGQWNTLESGYRLGLVVLMAFSLIALLLAIISVTPNYKQRKTSLKKMTDRDKNIFFFGHFANMGFDEYYEKMKNIVQDKDDLYKEMIKDMYQMGVVLHKEKFTLLFYSYRFFFAGLILSSIITLGQGILEWSTT